MFGSTILELAIGLVFIYLVFSLVCSGIKEWLHYLLSIRSKTLEEAIGKMLKSQALVKSLYSHHLIQEAAQAGIFKKAITSADQTVTQSISTEGEEDEKVEKPVNIPNESFANALVETIVRLVQQKDTSEEAKKAFEDVESGIKKIANNEARKVLTELIAKAQNKAADLKEEVEKTSKVMFLWFDNRMIKLSNWYRQKSRKLIFFFAVILVALFNVDSIMLIKTLSQNPDLRAAIVSQAENLSSQSNMYMERFKLTTPTTPAKSKSPDTSTNKPSETATSDNVATSDNAAASDNARASDNAATSDNDATSGNAENAENAENIENIEKPGMTTEIFFAELEALKAQVRATGLPLGWVERNPKLKIQDLRVAPDSFWGWVYKIIGLLISLMAIGMGAPFWFDVLKWLIGLRKGKSGSNSPPAKPPLTGNSANG